MDEQANYVSRSTKSRPRAASSGTSREDSSSREYEVESILAKQVERDGSTKFLLKWTGYSYPTWEPEDNIGCNRLIEEFERDVERARGRIGRSRSGGLSNSPVITNGYSDDDPDSDDKEKRNNHSKSFTMRDNTTTRSSIRFKGPSRRNI